MAQTYLHYLPCGDHEGRRAQERAQVARLHGAGLAVTTYLNPMVCESYAPVFGPAAAQGGLVRTRAGDPYLFRYSTDTSFRVAQFDFSSAAGRAGFGGVMREAIDDGHDGWMEDFGEYTPFDSISTRPRDGARMHNRYPTQYHCASSTLSRGAPRPIVAFVRSGFTGTPACAQVVWGGDPTVVYGFDGLASAVRQALSAGMSGVSRWGSDIGGFFAFFEDRLDDELLIRWLQLGAVSGVMRTQANGIDIPPKERPQVYDPAILPHWRRWTKLRTQLYPLLTAADAEYRRTGMPLMRHPLLIDPADPGADRARAGIRRRLGALRRARGGGRRADGAGPPPPRGLGRPVALGRLRPRERRPATRAGARARRPAHARAAGAARRAAVARPPRDGARAAPARGGHAGPVRRRRARGSSGSPTAPTGSTCSRSRRGRARSRSATTASACAHASPAGSGRCRSTGGGRGAIASRPR